MKIIVCVKQVPDTDEIRIDPKTGNMIREGVPSILNPDDKHAVAAAAALKEEHGGRVTVITMGPAQAEDTLRECLAMGADEAILLSDKAFSGADTWATSHALGTAIRKLGGYDLILCGRQAMDGNTAQVGPQIAEFLGLPQITYTRKVQINGNTLRAERALEDGYEVLETEMPALLTVVKDMNTPPLPPIDDILDAYRDGEIAVWTAADLDVERENIGLKGSPTRIRKAYSPELKRGKVEMLDGTAEAAVQALAAKLKEKFLI